MAFIIERTFITETMSDTILQSMLKFEGGTESDIRNEVQAHTGILPDDVWNIEYYDAGRRMALYDNRIRRY